MKKLKFRLILPLLLSLVLVLGSCMTVFAATYSFPEGYIDYGYNFIVDFGDNLIYWTSDKPFIISKDAAGGLMLSSPGCTKKRRIMNDNSNFTNYPESSTKAIALNGLVVYSDHNLFYDDGTLFFRVPLARLAVPLKGEIMKHLKTILPVGVGCLALLTGSVVLLPRLRRSLLRF